MSRYDVAAYVWPAYTGQEKRSRIFWPEGIGEWQTVKAMQPFFEGHLWPRKPLWGYVEEANPDVMQMQIDAAVSHGVNTFIYDWYWYDDRPFLENCLSDGFLKAKNNGRMKFYLMWANHDARHTWDLRNSDTNLETVVWSGQVDRTRFEIATNRMIEQYFRLPNYYKIDGKPVLAIYDIKNLIAGLGGVERTKAALDDFRARCVQVGLPGVHLQMLSGWMQFFDLGKIDPSSAGNQLDAVHLLGFDSVTNYQFVSFTNVQRDYLDILPDVEKQYRIFDREYDISYFPHVSVGWDCNPRYRRLHPNIITNNTQENVEQGFRLAKDYADNHPNQPPLITVNSWNEWTEGSYLEPDDLYGYGYLDAIKRVFTEE